MTDQNKVSVYRDDLERYVRYMKGTKEPLYGRKLFERLIEGTREGASESELLEIVQSYQGRGRNLAMHDSRILPTLRVVVLVLEFEELDKKIPNL